MDKIFYEENHNYKFDFTKAIDIFEPHDLSQKTTMLADADFVLDTESKIIFLEYKNAGGRNVTNTEAFRNKIFVSEKRVKFCKNIAKKFYSTLFLIWACNKNDEEKDIEYILLIEHPEIDGRIRKMLRNKITKQLPFRLLEDTKIKRKILSEFEVLNMDEWHLKYPKFAITEIE